MAAEDDVITPSSAHHSLNDVVKNSNEDNTNNVQETPVIVEEGDSNGLVPEGSIMTNSLPEARSHDLVGMTTRTRTRDHSNSDHMHTPTPCQNTNYLWDIMIQATKRSAPMCTSGPEESHIGTVLQTGEKREEQHEEQPVVGQLPSNISDTTNKTVDKELTQGDSETETVEKGEV